MSSVNSSDEHTTIRVLDSASNDITEKQEQVESDSAAEVNNGPLLSKPNSASVGNLNHLSPGALMISRLRSRSSLMVEQIQLQQLQQNQQQQQQQQQQGNQQLFVATPGDGCSGDSDFVELTRRYSNLSQCYSDNGMLAGDDVSMISGISGLRSLSLIYNSPPPYLVLERLEKMPLKDFSLEVRASLDIEKFVKEAILFLDISCHSIETVIENMLKKIFENEVSGDNPLDYWMQEAKKKLFIQASFLSYSYQRLCKTIKGISIDINEGLAMDQSWICTMASLPHLHKRHLAITRLSTPANLGSTNENIHFIILVITPTKEKGTKSEIELGRTFSTIMADIDFRQQLLCTENEQQFREVLQLQARLLAETQRLQQQFTQSRRCVRMHEVLDQTFGSGNSNPSCWTFMKNKCRIGGGVADDVKRRIPFYLSDYKDGFVGQNTLRKVISSTSFLYFSCLLPSIAFGVLNGNNTGNKIEVKRVIMSQFIGGLVFGIFGGQPLIVMLTTAPLALYTKVLFMVSKEFKLDFLAVFAWTGLFNAIFLIIYSLTDLSKMMKWSTRSTEEVFALFVAIAFIVDASKDIHNEFSLHYNCVYDHPEKNGTTVPTNISSLNNSSCSLHKLLNDSVDQIMSTATVALTTTSHNSAVNLTRSTISPMKEFHRNLHQGHNPCHRDISVLYLLLTIGTVWLAGHLNNFTKTPFLNASKRELFADFSLPLAITFMSFTATVIFKDIQLDPFYYDKNTFRFMPIDLRLLSGTAIISCAALAFPLSLLFFMEQNMASIIVNSPTNKLKKGATFHWDLLIVALINGFLSIFGLPWVHGAIPHSPLHVKSLSDIEEKIDSGHKVHQTIVRVRETRVTGILSHLLIAISLLLMLPHPLMYIPIAVLDGLFIHMGISSLSHNQLCERISLLFTEQSAYPPSHYLRRVPQRKLHLFTFFQVMQLLVLCALGFSPNPYMKLGFPLVLILQLVVRHKVIPCFIDEIYINEMDKST